MEKLGYDEAYIKLREAAHELEPWFDVDEVKTYGVYVWTKGDDDTFGENVFDIFTDHLQFYPTTEYWVMPIEVWPIIKKIQELLMKV